VSAATDALGAALAAEHAAIFGYDVLGPHLDVTDQKLAHSVEEAHRARRDAVTAMLTAAGASAPAAAAAYALPFPVTDRASALKLATTLEDGSAQAWHGALAMTSGADRTFALNALIDCAVRATRWRLTAGVTPTTTTFPGTAS
jgi:hypothetical protein